MSLTVRQRDALKRHRAHHIKKKSFKSVKDLTTHMSMMRMQMNKGDSFAVAHRYALKHGPKIKKMHHCK